MGGINTSSFNATVLSIATDINNNVYAAGLFTNEIFPSGNNYVAKWDGTSWNELGGNKTSTFNSWINSIITDKTGYVYAAGNFTKGSSYNIYYYVAKYTQTLPVKLSSISAAQENKDIAIKWHTSTKLNTSHFIVQHSTDGSSFTDIGTVPATGRANGYSFIDNQPTNGTNYYRLKSVDKDGATSFSKVVSASLTTYDSRLTTFPNPTKDVVTVKGNHIASVEVIDNAGRIIKVITLKDATNPILSVSGLQAGLYHLRIQTSDGKVSAVGMVKQ